MTRFDRRGKAANHSPVYPGTEHIAPVFKDRQRKNSCRVHLKIQMAQLAGPAKAS
jgi:hypothetical protein